MCDKIPADSILYSNFQKSVVTRKYKRYFSGEASHPKSFHSLIINGKAVDVINT